jgi:hypothetical protein
MEIIIPLVVVIVGAYLTYRYAVSRDRLNTKRERLLKNIEKVEQFLSLTLELEAITLQEKEDEREFEETRKKFDQMVEKDAQFKEENKDFEANLAILAEYLSQAMKKNVSTEGVIGLRSILPHLENETKIEEEIKRMEERTTRLNETKAEFNNLSLNLVEKTPKLIAQRNRLQEMLKEYSKFDIDVVCQIIDPSTKLGDRLSEFRENHLKLVNDIENESYIRKTKDLRSEILKLLENKIK